MSIKKLCGFILPMLLLNAPVRPVAAQTTTTPAATPCILGYTVGFFNGVANTEMDALITLNQIKGSVEEVTNKPDDTYNNEDVKYQVFYNHTGSTVNATTFQDIAETFIQRQNEIDPTGFFSANHLYMMWEQINGGGSTSYLSYTTNRSEFGSFLNTVTQAFVVEMASEISKENSNPPTASDYDTQNAQLDSIADSGRKMLLIAHSQGNLFVNHAYGYIQPKVGSTRVKVVHVAPASPTLSGQYILSDNDQIINQLRIVGGTTSVVDNNISIAFSYSEATGHSMGPTYLDTTPGRNNGRIAVEGLEAAALAALTAPPGCAVQLTPATPTLASGASQTFTAILSSPTVDPILLTEYTWSVSGTAGGTLTGGVTTLTTSTNTVGYTVPASAASGTADKISVKVAATKTQGDTVNAVDLGSGTASISISNVKLSVVAAAFYVNAGSSLGFSAAVSGAATPPGSLLWTTSGKYGSFATSCTSGLTNTYKSNANTGATAGTTVSDTVTVQAFADPSCGAGTGNSPLASATTSAYVKQLKDVSAWLGTWSNCTNTNRPGYNFYVTVYAQPYPQLPNTVDFGSNSDLFFLVQNHQDLSQSSNFIDVVATNTTLAFDDRFSSYDAAYNAGYNVYSIAGGTFQWSNSTYGTGYFSCTR